MIDKKKIESLKAEWSGLMGRHTVFELLDEIEHLRDQLNASIELCAIREEQLEKEIAYSSKLREALRHVEPYCRKATLPAMDNYCTWTKETCLVCGAEFSRDFGEHKENCPFYEEKS